MCGRLVLAARSVLSTSWPKLQPSAAVQPGPSWRVHCLGKARPRICHLTCSRCAASPAPARSLQQTRFHSHSIARGVPSLCQFLELPRYLWHGSRALRGTLAHVAWRICSIWRSARRVQGTQRKNLGGVILRFCSWSPTTHLLYRSMAATSLHSRPPSKAAMVLVPISPTSRVTHSLPPYAALPQMSWRCAYNYHRALAWQRLPLLQE